MTQDPRIGSLHSNLFGVRNNESWNFSGRKLKVSVSENRLSKSQDAELTLDKKSRVSSPMWYLKKVLRLDFEFPPLYTIPHIGRIVRRDERARRN